MKNKKILFIVFATILFIFSFVILIIINWNEKIDSENDVQTITESKKYEQNDSIVVNDLTDYYQINLSDDNSTGDNMKISDNTITITKDGTYVITGSLSNGEIIVDAKGLVVNLILNNVDLNNDNGPAIYVKKSKKVIITLWKESINNLSDGSNYSLETGEDEPNGTIFSKSDLTINGTGTLNINSNYEDAIVSKDILRIMSGAFNINAEDDAIRAKDALIIKDGTFNIESNGSGLKSTNTEDSTLGYIVIDDGKFNINSNDDAVHANGDITINKGNFDITSGDDGIHADDNLTILNGTITINECYEGLEATIIHISGGNITIYADDDGINGAGGVDESATSNRSRGGIGNFSTSTGSLQISGGTIYVNAVGDGVDVNGNITMSGGNLIIEGPTDNGNGSLDYDGFFNISGGSLLSIGSSGMLQTPSSSSPQNSISILMSGNKGDKIIIKDSESNVLFEYTTTKTYSSIVASCSDFTKNNTYSIYINNNLLTTLTLNNTITQYGNSYNNGNIRR